MRGRTFLIEDGSEAASGGIRRSLLLDEWESVVLPKTIAVGEELESAAYCARLSQCNDVQVLEYAPCAWVG